MQFPNQLQVALIFDRPLSDFDHVAGRCAAMLEIIYGQPFNAVERKPDAFFRYFGGDELMVTLEHVDRPPSMAMFEQPLGSVVTGLLCPDVRSRLNRSVAMILIDVSHGVLGGAAQEPKLAAFLDSVGMRQGASLGQFRQRLKVLAILSRLAADLANPVLVHWTQSNQLFAGEMFDKIAEPDAPSLLHIHPYLFGPKEPVEGQQHVGIRTFAARHFIGRELLVEPGPIPWSDTFETVLAFLRVALADKGYIIPDGDSFGPDDGSFSYRVRHLEPDEGGVPLIELSPLMHREHGFVSPDYVPRECAIDDRCPPPAIMPADENAKAELANEWREKRKLAEGIGGRLEVRTRTASPSPSPPRPGPGPLAGRVIFGRKKG